MEWPGWRLGRRCSPLGLGRAVRWSGRTGLRLGGTPGFGFIEVIRFRPGWPACFRPTQNVRRFGLARLDPLRRGFPLIFGFGFIHRRVLLERLRIVGRMIGNLGLGAGSLLPVGGIGSAGQRGFSVVGKFLFLMAVGPA